MNTFKPSWTTRMGEYKYHLVLSFEDQGETYYVVFNKERGYRIVKHRSKKED